MVFIINCGRNLIMKARPAYFNSIISGAESDLELISFSLQMAETLKQVITDDSFNLGMIYRYVLVCYSFRCTCQCARKQARLWGWLDAIWRNFETFCVYYQQGFYLCRVVILYFLFSFRVAFFGIFSNFLGSVELNLAVLLHCSKYLVELSRLGWCRKPASSLVDDGPAVAEMF